MSAQPVVAPILYVLTDAAGNEIIYQPAGSTLWYGPPTNLMQYTPTTLDSPLGSLVTARLTPIAFPFIRTLTLVVPRVNMGNTPIQSINTIAIFTTDRLNFPFPVVGQLQSYTVDPLQGEAFA
jgi:hypothetical protein